MNFSIGSASPDGTHFAFSPQIAPYRIEVFAIGKEKPIVTIKDEKLAEWGRGCRLSHDNKLLAVSVGGQAVRVWEVASGRVVATYAGPDLRLLTFAFSPDGKTLAAMFIAMSERLRMSDPKTLVLWDTSLGVERLRIPDWKGYVVGYSHGGKKLVSLDQNEVVLADAATGKPTGSLNGHAANERLQFAFSPDLRKAGDHRRERSISDHLGLGDRKAGTRFRRPARGHPHPRVFSRWWNRLRGQFSGTGKFVGRTDGKA